MKKTTELIAWITVIGLFIGATIALGITAKSNMALPKKIHQANAQLLDQGISKRALNYKLQLPDGSSVTLNSLLQNHKVVMVNFWGSFCAPCKEEFPSLLDLVRHYPDLKVIAVSYDDSWTALKNFIPNYGVSFKFNGLQIVMDKESSEEDLKTIFGTEKIPETYLIIDNKIRARFIGSVDWNSPKVRALFDYLFGVSG